MTRNAKVAVAAGAVIALAVLLLVLGLPVVGAVVLVAGIAVVTALLRRGGDDGGDTSWSKLDRAVGERAGPAGALPAAGPGDLPTWSPAARDTDRSPRLPSSPAGRSWGDPDRPPVGDEFDDDNPLAALDRLRDVDPVAEVERLEGLSTAGASARTPGAFRAAATGRLDEAAVRSSDDIMAASQATELHVSAGEDSELARLLAKVQQRLAAYE